MPTPPEQSGARLERHLAACAMLASLALWAAVALPHWCGLIYTADDLGAFHLPLRAWYAEQLAAGEPFDWLPHLFGGFYITGEGQLGAYHPAHLLLYAWLDPFRATALESLFVYPALWCGAYCLLRRHRLRRDAAACGALFTAFSSFTLLRFMHVNALAVVAHLPWLLLAIDVRLAVTTRRTAAHAELAIVLLTASQLLLGYPQYVWISLLAEGAYALGVLKKYNANAIDLVCIAIAKCAAALVASVQLMPTWSMLSESTRAAADAGLAAYGSLHPANLLQLFAPYLFAERVWGQNTHELGIYAGSVALLLVVWLLAECPRVVEGRWLAIAGGLLFAGGLLLALGAYGGLHRWTTWLPIVGKFRFPARYWLLAQLGIAVIAAIGFAGLVQNVQRQWERTVPRGIVAVWVTALASITIAGLGPLVFPSERLAAAPHIVAGPLLFCIAATLITAAARGHAAALVGLVVFAAIDIGIYGLSYTVYPHVERHDRYLARVELPPDWGGGRVAMDLTATVGSGLYTGNQILLCGGSRVDGYAGLLPRRQLDYRTPAALSAAGVQWVHRRAAAQLADEQLLSEKVGDSRWFQLGDAAPRAHLVTTATPSVNPQQDLVALDLNSEALVERPLSLPQSLAGIATLLCDRPGNVQLHTLAPTRQLLVTTECFHDGWQVAIDGQASDALRVNGDFLGCVVPAGPHTIAFRFDPRSREWGAAISCGGLALTLATFLVRSRHELQVASANRSAESATN